MRFLCLGYMDEQKWDAMSKDEQDAMIEECFAFDDVMRRGGNWARGGQALQSARTAKTLSWDGGKAVVTDGPYAETKEQLGGIGVLEADDMDHAVELLSKHPCIRYGPVEVRPVDEGFNARYEERENMTRRAMQPDSANKGGIRVMVLVKATRESEAGEMPGEQLLTEMGKFNEELVNAGVMLAGEGLHPSSKGARVRFKGKERTVIDGPFAETKELIAGYWLWRVKSMDEAIAWVKRCPNPMESESEIEIRRVFEADDFGEALTPELREQEDRMRAELERRPQSMKSA